MLDRQSQGPQCTACGSPMELSEIEPSSAGQEQRAFTCPECKRVQRYSIDSAVTKAWLEPQGVIKARHGNAVTYEVHNGCLIPKLAR